MKKFLNIGVAFSCVLFAVAPQLARATCSSLSVPAASMSNVPLLYAYGATLGPGGTPGASPIAANSDCTIGGSGGGGGGGAVTAAAGSYVDGSLVTLGTEADSAYTGSGNATDTSILKGIYNIAANPPSTPVTGTFFQATQPISATALPLPSGAATAALQSSVQSAAGTAASSVITVQGSASGVPQPINGTVSLTAPAAGAWAGAEGYGQGSTTAGQFGPLIMGTNGTTDTAILVDSTGNMRTTLYSGAVSAINGTAKNGAGTGGFAGLQNALIFNSTITATTSATTIIQQGTSNGSVHSANTPTADAAVGIQNTGSASSGILLKSTAGNLYKIVLAQNATTAGFIVEYDATAVPAASASLTASLVRGCLPIAANGGLRTDMIVPDSFANGIVLLDSTSCSTYTAVVPVFLAGGFQ